MYNTSAYDNATTLLKITQATNSVSDGFFFPLCVMLVSQFIIFIGLKKAGYEVSVCIMGSSFICGIIGIGGWALDLVSTKLVFYPIILTAGSIIFYMLTRD